MSDILSQDEVDALLRGVADGTVPVPEGTPVPRGAVRAIDLTERDRSLRGRLPGLELVVERLLRLHRSTLTPFFGKVPNLTVESIEVVKFERLLAGLPQPMCLSLFSLAPLRGQGMIVVPAPVVAALLQAFFGGVPGRPAQVASRDFSAIELRVIERLVHRLLADLREAWLTVTPLECAFVRSETSPTFARIAEPAEPVVKIDLRVDVDDCKEGILICMPSGALDPIRPRLQRLRAAGSEGESRDTTWTERLRAAVVAAPIDVAAELGTRTMSLRAVLNLRAGDLLTLGTGREGPVLVRVGGLPSFLGVPGVSAGNNAVRVTARA